MGDPQSAQPIVADQVLDGPVSLRFDECVAVFRVIAAHQVDDRLEVRPHG